MKICLGLSLTPEELYYVWLRDAKVPRHASKLLLVLNKDVHHVFGGGRWPVCQLLSKLETWGAEGTSKTLRNFAFVGSPGVPHRSESPTYCFCRNVAHANG